MGLYAGYEVPLFSTVGVSGQLGYRYCSFKRPNVAITRSQEFNQMGSVVTSSSPLLDAGGDPMDVDLSGLRINLGLTLRLAAQH